ncbi:MAG: mechanosensitive ion channel family protein [Candidatus Wukongarchaeota archaeon]|nr:mechanosensitive ion channel family protein [Candidatus Wukongarchaeota archaeon]
MVGIKDIEQLIEKIAEVEYLQFLVIVIGTLIVSKIVHSALLRYAKKISEKAEREIRAEILNVIIGPLYLFIIFIGLYLGLRSLSELEEYYKWMDRIIFIISALLIALVFSRILLVFTSRWLRVEKKFEKTPQLINKIIALLVYLIAFLIILDHFDIAISPLVAAFGIAGLAIALALQSTLSNLFAGLNIISDRPVDVGDFIELEGGLTGYVEDIGWRSTRIRTLPNTLVTIPNSKLAESIITNHSKPVPEMSVVVQCGVAYDSDLTKVEKVTIEVATEIQKTVPGALKTFEPFIRYHTFGDSNINFSIILRIEKPVDRFLVVHEFMKALKARYDKEGIEISWPIRKLYQIK